MNSVLTILLASFAFLPHALAVPVGPGAITDVAGGTLNPGLGGGTFGGIALFMATGGGIASTGGFVLLVNVLAVLAILLSAILIIVRQDEGELIQLKTVIGVSLSAVILVNLRAPLLGMYQNIIGAPATAATIVSDEAIGIIDFIEVPLGVLAVLMIIISGIRAVINYGSDEGLTQLRRTIVSVGFGIVIIASKFIIQGSIITSGANPTGGNPNGIIDTVVDVINIGVAIMGLMSVIMIIYAALLMILNTGNDEQYSRARRLIIRVAIGLIVLLSSAVLVNFLVIVSFG